MNCQTNKNFKIFQKSQNFDQNFSKFWLVKFFCKIWKKGQNILSIIPNFWENRIRIADFLLIETFFVSRLRTGKQQFEHLALAYEANYRIFGYDLSQITAYKTYCGSARLGMANAKIRTRALSFDEKLSFLRKLAKTCFSTLPKSKFRWNYWIFRKDGNIKRCNDCQKL